MFRNKVWLMLSLATLFLAACVGSGTATQQGTHERVLGAGVLRAGIRFDFPPVSYIDEDGNWIGFDVDIAAEIARRLRVSRSTLRRALTRREAAEPT